MSRSPKPNGRRGRRPALREPKRRFFIACEGEKTEPQYLSSFAVPGVVEVRVVGDGYNTTSLVTWAEKKLGELERGGESFDEVWVVFDRDDFLPEAFNRAVEEVRRRDQSREADAPSWSAAWSNEAFELWYLLHFQSLPMDARMDRVVVTEKLGAHLRQAGLGSYTKNRPDLGGLLRTRLPTALQNAQSLHRQWAAARGVDPTDDPRPAQLWSHTLVWRLVQSLTRG